MTDIINSSFLRKASLLFFKNKNREHSKSFDQLIWSKECLDLSNKIVSEIKKLDFSKMTNEELFDTIYQKELASGRRTIANKINQKTNSVGRIREEKDNFYTLLEINSGSLNEISGIIQENYTRAKEIKGLNKFFMPYFYSFDPSTKEFAFSANFFEGGFSTDLRRQHDLFKAPTDKDEFENYKKLKLEVIYKEPQKDISKQKDYIGQKIRNCVEWDRNDINDLYKNIAELKWSLLAQEHFVKGTSSMADILEHALYSVKDVAVFPRKNSEISRDLRALLYPSAEFYSLDYLKEFNSKWLPTKIEDLKKSKKILSLGNDFSQDLQRV